MQVAVKFHDERLEFDLPAEGLVGSWRGPEGLAPAEAAALLRRALEDPLDFPPFRQMFVPGDRVAIALDAGLAEVRAVLSVLGDVLRQAGVASEEVTVVSTPDGRADLAGELSEGMNLEIHDPNDRGRLAYLATTAEGRRIYLNRHLTDADVVIPVGRLGYEPILGYRGPWSVIFPGLSDQETAVSYRQRLSDDPPGRAFPRPRLDEPFEVSWLLGTRFQVGLVPGTTGLVEVVAGLAESVRDRGITAIDRLWSFQPESRAELVVVGIGTPGPHAGIEDLVEGLVTAMRLVQHGGKIVALSRARGPIGPSLRRLIDAGYPKNMPAALRGHDADADSIAGRRLAQVLAWADVYLLSALDGQVVEDLSMVPLNRLEDARRLAAASSSCLLVSQADLTRGVVREKRRG
jgi:lactate racemase